MQQGVGGAKRRTAEGADAGDANELARGAEEAAACRSHVCQARRLHSLRPLPAGSAQADSPIVLGLALLPPVAAGGGQEAPGQPARRASEPQARVQTNAEASGQAEAPALHGQPGQPALHASEPQALLSADELVRRLTRRLTPKLRPVAALRVPLRPRQQVTARAPHVGALPAPSIPPQGATCSVSGPPAPDDADAARSTDVIVRIIVESMLNVSRSATASAVLDR